MLKDSRLFFRALVLLLLVYGFNYLAEIFYFHWTLWWYDVILHFMGGACAATAFIYFYYIFFKFSQFNKIKAINLSFVFTLFVGLVWEVYELQQGDTSFSDGIFYYRDTISDLIVDCCGGFFATTSSFKFFENISDRILGNGK
ncbi:MAG: hypothetical protein WAW92_03225 [Minisyncoccia bacterium]